MSQACCDEEMIPFKRIDVAMDMAREFEECGRRGTAHAREASLHGPPEKEEEEHEG